MIPKRLRLAPLALLLLAVTSGCSATPKPEPTPTPAFASEEEAFAAAEKVYRQYNDASNETGTSTDLLVGFALEGELEAHRHLEQNHLTLEGDSVVTSFTGISADIDSPIAVLDARVCLDISQVILRDSAGNDVTSMNRADVIAFDVTFVSSTDGLLISDSETAMDQSC